MEPKEVDRLIHKYQYNKCRLQELRLRMAFRDAEWEKIKRSLFLGEQLNGQQITDMPHGSGAKNPVEDLMIRFESGRKPDVFPGEHDEEAADWEEKKTLLRDVTHVEVWMSCLDEKSLFVITEKMIHNRRWDEIERMALSRLGEEMTISGLRHIKRRGMQIIYEIAR